MAVIDATSLDQIGAKARDIDPGRLLLTIIAAVFYVVGWVPSKLVLGVFWCCAAIRLGWVEARKPRARVE